MLVVTILTTAFSQTSIQVLVDKIYEHSTGQPDTLDWSDSDLDPSRNLVVCGNTLVNGQDTNLLLTKYDPESNMLWQQTFNNSTNGNDYGVAVKTDGSGNIFVACASYRGSTNDYDYNILKYNSSGTLQWQTYYNGTGSSYDVPTALVLDGSGNIYVTGTSVQTGNLNDYLTMKLNSSGTIQWTNNYDYVHLSDIPGAIELGTNSRIIVSGGSSNSISDWDFTTVKYNTSTGAQTSVNRNSSVGAGFDFATAIAKDAYGNFYITGKAYRSGTGYDIKTIKLDTSLSLQWTKYYDLENAEDGAWDVEVDAYNYLYVTGFVSHSNGHRDMITIKYNSSGTEQWHRNYVPQSPFTKAESRRISIDPYNAIYITGFQNDGSQSDIVTISYDLNGNIRWLRNWIGSGGGDDIPSFIKYDVVKQRIYITARTWTGTQNAYENIWYEEYFRLKPIQNDANGLPYCVANEIIVRFNPSKVITTFVNDKEKYYEKPINVIDSLLLVQMFAKTRIDFVNNRDVKILKIHYHLSTSDTVSITRLNQTISIPKFWSTFVLILPAGFNPVVIGDSLNHMKPDILYAEPNYIYRDQDIPNDVEYPNQFSLNNDAQFPDADIDMDPGWDVSHGSTFVKIGVYDTGIDWHHEDFSIDGSGTFAGSKIIGGWDWFNNMAISSLTTPDPDGHGSACAGIIGALRNNGASNNTGIAGITGGDMQNATTDWGCQLFAMKIADLDTFLTADLIAPAIIEGATYIPNGSYGYGLHITNHSYGSTSNSQTLFDAVQFSFQNQVSFVAARGNVSGNLSETQLIYPACYDDAMVLNTGGSGTDGERKVDGNGNGSDATDQHGVTMFGNGLDFMAPATNALVLTTDNAATGYVGFNGTSAAAPHVAGVAGLMLSECNNAQQNHPDNLAPEDVEFILQGYAQDRGPCVGCYDDETGWGLIDAGNSLAHVEKPDYKIWHPATPVTGIQTADVNQGSFVVLLGSSVNGLSIGYYYANRHHVTKTFHNAFASTTTILDGWARLSSGNGYGLGNALPSSAFLDNVTVSINGNQGDITISGYTYYVTGTYPFNSPVNVWVPCTPANLQTPYSWHLYDPTGLLGVDDVNEIASQLKLFPNPANDQTTVSISNLNCNNAVLDLLDINGTVLMTQTIGQIHSDETKVLDVADLVPGIYFVRLRSNEETEFAKLIKVK